jgi:hypothetical protein
MTIYIEQIPYVDGGWTEPESAANTDYQPIYPYNNVTQTEAGHKFEMDDTPTRERIRLSHRTGTFIEMHPDGSEVHKVFGNGYTIIVQDNNVRISGNCNIQIDGNCNFDVAGNMGLQVGGNFEMLVAGDTQMRTMGKLVMSGDGDVELSASESFGGTLFLNAADHVAVSSDLEVAGMVSADVVTAESKVIGGNSFAGGVYAGLDGFTTSGGVSAGFPTPATPIAVPGQINAIGTINAVISVNAPIANFSLGNIGVLKSVLMSDSINSAIYDTHIHPTTDGTTFMPDVPFVGT